MQHQLPDGDTLAKYMYLLHRVLLKARARAYHTDSQIADLLDAVENIPDLILRWPDMDESIVLRDLRRIEASYPEWKDSFTMPLERGAPDGWQAKRK